jgi:lactate permease
MVAWRQDYNPLGIAWLSTLLAAVPIIGLLASIALLNLRIHFAALLGLLAALAIALGVFRMPWDTAAASALFGAGYGLFPIGWLILNVMFLYRLTVQRGHFDVLRDSLATVAPDARVQLILIAFAFGALLEGLAGFGAPVAITAAILIQLGFKPLPASGLALIANTAPVAFGSLGIPITTLEQVTGIDARLLSAMAGRQLFLFSLMIPFWIVAAFAGWRAMLGVWPAALTAGLAFAIPQLLVSNLHGPWLASIAGGACATAATVLLMRVWRPAERYRSDGTIEAGWRDSATTGHTTDPTDHRADPPTADPASQPHVATAATGAAASVQVSAHRSHSKAEVIRAWVPWTILTLFILVWGLPDTKIAFDRIAAPVFAMPHLHRLVQRTAPVAAPGALPEPAELKLNVLSATGTGILCAAVLGGLIMGFSWRTMAGAYLRTLWHVRFSLLTIAAMLALGNVTKYSGADATLGLALAGTGVLYPFFGTILGWLGVALTGSDTASNVLFGSLQKITSQQLGVNPILMCAANSAGGVMGKMVDAQSIVVASTATNWYGRYGHESAILRFVFLHSLVLAVLMGLTVLLEAYWGPLAALVVK